MKSLHARLTLALVAAGALLFTALGAAVYLRTRALLTAQFDDSLRARSAALISLLQWEPDGSVELNYKDEFMPEFERRRGGFYFAVWMEKDGSLLEKSRSLHKGTLPRFTGTVAAPEFRDFQIGKASVRAIGIRTPGLVEKDAGKEGREPSAHAAGLGADIVVAGNTTALHARLHTLALELSAGGALGIAAIALLIRATLRIGLRPLDELAAHAARLDATRLAERFPDTGLPAELAPIAARLNDLLSRLQTTFERERRFSADVAHELRTPIAELHTLAEVGTGLAADGHASADIGAFFQDARDIAHRMGSTVATLTLLARCESGGQPIATATVGLADWFEPLLAETAARARIRGLIFNPEILDAPLDTDAEILTRLLRLLLDNALEYTARGGTIALRADAREIALSNGPTALTPADLPHLGERFWRKDPARTDSAHSGLGLALAAELARILGLNLAHELAENSALTVRLNRG